MMFPGFETDEKNGETPLVSGLFVDLGMHLEKEETVVRAVREMQKRNPDFKPPFLVMDLAAPEDVTITGEASYPPPDADDSLVSEDYELNKCVKLLVPCSQVVDLSKLGGLAGSNQVVKCNQMIPVYRWFQAANLLLHQHDKPGRLIPFPLDHDKGTTYHMLPVNQSEFKLYQELLDFGTTNQGVEEGFATSARISYEILGKRGIKEISAEEVDKLIAHVMVGHNDGTCQGLLLHRAGREDLEDLKTSHFIYY
jgi:hypothetical protein